ncbi:MAG TPA: hypothetical protein ENG51_20485 [Deltaproteobacteria bacterium]|nr:hypothetical protein [Deltaproteobacteria bacterium]
MALVLNVDNKVFNEGVWCEYEEGARFRIRPLTPKKYRELRNRCTSHQWKRGQLVEKVDEDKLNEMVNDWIIADWEGIVDATGKPIPCTKENKQVLLDNFTEIAAFVNDMALKVAEQAAKSREEEKKN